MPRLRVGCAVGSRGTPESLIPLCSTITDWNGERRPFTAGEQSKVLQTLNEFAQGGLRVLALAWKEGGSPEATQSQVEGDLSFLAITGMMDPPRPEVPAAIEKCRQAGVRIIMVTGDFGITAWAVAGQIGMGLDKRFPVITGEAVSRMPEQELRRLLKREGDMVFARTSPEEKLRIVMALRNLGQVVAVTGDGVNDAPALKAADIGVAMGKRAPR